MSSSHFLPLYLTVPSDFGWLCAFVLDFSVFLVQAAFTPCGQNQSRLHPSPTRHGLRFPSRTVEEAGQSSLLFPQRASAVAVLDVSFSKFSIRSLQLGRIHPSLYQAPPRRLSALRFHSRVIVARVVPGRRPETDRGGAGGAVPRRRVVVRRRLALPSPRPSEGRYEFSLCSFELCRVTGYGCRKLRPFLNFFEQNIVIPSNLTGRLLTLGESYCEDEAKTLVEKMLNQVHIVGEGIIGEALGSGECRWIYDTTCHALNQTSHADNQDLLETIAVLPLRLQGLVQFGSAQKVPRNSDFLNQVRNIFDQMKNTSRDGSMEYTRSNSLACVQQPILTSSRSANDILVHNKVNPLKSEKLEENIERTESIRSSICSPSNSQRSLNDFTPHGTGNSSMDTHILAMPVNSKSIYELEGFDKVTNFFHQNANVRTQVQVNSSKMPDSIIASIMSAYQSSNNLHSITKESSGQNMPEYPPYLYTTTNPPNSGLDELCYSSADFSSSLTIVSEKSTNYLQNESDKLLYKSVSLSSNPCVSEIQGNCLTPHHVPVHKQSLIPGPGECGRLLSPEESFIVQSDSMQVKDTTHSTCQTNSTCPELPNRPHEEATAGTSDNNMKECSGNNCLLESMMLDPSTNSFVQDWWDDSVLLAGNLPNLGNTHSDSAIELASKHPFSSGERGLPSISAVEQLFGVGAPRPAGHGPLGAEANPLSGCVSDYQLPQFPFRDCITAYNAQVPSLASSSYTSGNVQNGSSKETSVPPGNISVDDTCSFNTANSKGSQSNNPEGVKVAKKRAKAGESTRPRPKDRQLIQDRVKELREIVPNGAKCSIDALLERTIKHMLFLQSVTKYAEKIKQADEPKLIDKESGVVLKDNPDGGKNGGVTWAYEVAGKTMVCPIIIEDLSPPGQILIEMLCEERWLFLEIADNIRGFGLTILKGLMELRDGKIWARFLVEANREVTRMDIFLSLVQLLEQNSLVQSTEQMAKVMNNGVPSFTDHQLSPLPIPVGIAERLQ